MANTAQAKKRVRQAENTRVHNRKQASTMRTSIKGFLKAIQEDNADGAREMYKAAVSKIDKAARKHNMHANRAARLKSRLNARLKAIAA